MLIKIKKYNDVWLDNGLITFFEILKSIEENYPGKNLLYNVELTPFELAYEIANVKEFVKYLGASIRSHISDLIVEVEDKKTQEKKEVKKEHILIQEKAKIAGKVDFKEEIYNAKKNEDVIKTIYDGLNGNKKRCAICGSEYKSAFKKLQQASYPFVTKIKSLSSIRSGRNIKLKEYISEYCPRCYLNGIIEWLDSGMVYRTIPGKKSIIILPQAESLQEVKNIKTRYKGILNNNERWSNIRVTKGDDKTESTPEKYTTLMSFYENFIYETKIEKDLEWHVIEIPAGAVKNPKSQSIHIGNEMISFLFELVVNNDMLFYREFVKEFYVFNNDMKKGIRNFDLEKEIYEHLCQSIISNNFQLFADCFIPRKSTHVGLSKEARTILENIIKIWRLTKMSVEDNEQYLKTLRLAGQSIASLIGNRLGLFFKLEKAKSTNQFLEVMQEITRRLTIEKERFTSNIDDYKRSKGKKELVFPASISNIVEELEKRQERNDRKFFEDTKNILLIYASLNVFRKEQVKEVSNEQ